MSCSNAPGLNSLGTKRYFAFHVFFLRFFPTRVFFYVIRSVMYWLPVSFPVRRQLTGSTPRPEASTKAAETAWFLHVALSRCGDNFVKRSWIRILIRIGSKIFLPVRLSTSLKKSTKIRRQLLELPANVAESRPCHAAVKLLRDSSNHVAARITIKL